MGQFACPWARLSVLLALTISFVTASLQVQYEIKKKKHPKTVCYKREVNVFSPCTSSAYNKSSGRTIRTGSRRQRDRILGLGIPNVIQYTMSCVRHWCSNKVDSCMCGSIGGRKCVHSNLHPWLVSSQAGQRRSLGTRPIADSKIY